MNGSLNLRQYLRHNCKASHDALDAAMAPWAWGEEYPSFLRVQYAARVPIEAWLAANSPQNWLPPCQSALLAADLAALHVAPPAPAEPLRLPADAFLGVAWAIAGSSVGNRAMLQRRQKSGQRTADRFLSDLAMTNYWARLLPRLEASGADDGGLASEGAQAVFRLFRQCAGVELQDLAA